MPPTLWPPTGSGTSASVLRPSGLQHSAATTTGRGCPGSGPPLRRLLPPWLWCGISPCSASCTPEREARGNIEIERRAAGRPAAFLLKGVDSMGGCQAAMAAGWSALCGATGLLGQVQSQVARLAGVGSALSSLGPLQAGVLLIAGLVALVLAWHVFLWLADLIFRYFPLALGAAALTFLIHR